MRKGNYQDKGYSKEVRKRFDRLQPGVEFTFKALIRDDDIEKFGLYEHTPRTTTSQVLGRFVRDGKAEYIRKRRGSNPAQYRKIADRTIKVADPGQVDMVQLAERLMGALLDKTMELRDKHRKLSDHYQQLEEEHHQLRENYIRAQEKINSLNQDLQNKSRWVPFAKVQEMFKKAGVEIE